MRAVIQRDPKGKFLPGTGGRPAGARNKLQAQFVTALAEDFAEHGAGVIRIVRVEEPATYLKVIASILPKEFLLAPNVLEDMSDAELQDALQALRKIKDKHDGAVPTEH